jgi:hypothetical protein
MGVKTLTKLEIRRLDMMNQREEIVPQCKKYGDKEEFCKRIDSDGIHCSAYIKPEIMWRLGPCALATHVIEMETKAQEKIRIGQQKHSHKRRNR